MHQVQCSSPVDLFQLPCRNSIALAETLHCLVHSACECILLCNANVIKQEDDNTYLQPTYILYWYFYAHYNTAAVKLKLQWQAASTGQR